MGRPALSVRLLVWALAVVAIDVAVIATKDDKDKATTATAQAPTSTVTNGGSNASTSESVVGDATSSTLPGEDPTSTVETTEPGAETTVPLPGSNDVVVAHLEGDGETPLSAPFVVMGRWELRWHVESGGGGVAATVEDNQTHESIQFVPMDAGDDSVAFPIGCDCTLQLVPDGSAYDVRVVDVEG